MYIYATLLNYYIRESHSERLRTSPHVTGTQTHMYAYGIFSAARGEWGEPIEPSPLVLNA